MKLNPKGKEVKKTDFTLEYVDTAKYISSLLEGDPEKSLFGELVFPLIERCKGADSLEKVKARLQGFHYLVPTPFYGELEGWMGLSANKLDKWRYTVQLISSDREMELTFVFRVPLLLSEEQLIKYITDNADWSLARTYII